MPPVSPSSYVNEVCYLHEHKEVGFIEKLFEKAVKIIKLVELLNRASNPSVCRIAEYGYQNTKILYRKVLNKNLSLYH